MSSGITENMWDQALELASMSLEKSNRELVDVVDRFTWDTGSDEDRARIASLELSISIKKGIASYFTDQIKGK